MQVKGLNAGSKHSFGDLSTDLNGVVAVSENLRLNDGSKTILLADSSVSSEGVGSLRDRKLGWAAISNLENGSPLGESCASLVILLASFSETVKASSCLLLFGSWQEHQALINLDAWDDILGLE